MGFIYKITNLTNNKCYIGQTRRNYKDRWAEHKRDKNKEPYCNWPLYRMLNSVDEKMIKWEVIEEINNDILNEREQYWISYYNSYFNGYNATLGGDSNYKHDYQEILSYWLNEGEKNFTKTAEYFNSNKSYISKIIHNLGYKTRSWSEINGNNHETTKRKVNQIDLLTGKVLNTYESLTKAAIAMGDVTITKSLSNICNGIRPSLYGYGWQYAEDIGKPIYLNKQQKWIILPEKNLKFNDQSECADWFIENNICRSKNRYKVSSAIRYALNHSGLYFGIKLEEKEKVIYTYYEQ